MYVTFSTVVDMEVKGTFCPAERVVVITVAVLVVKESERLGLGPVAVGDAEVGEGDGDGESWAETRPAKRTKARIRNRIACGGNMKGGREET